MLQAVRMSCADADRRGSMPRVLVDLPTGNRRTQRPFLLKTTRLAMMTSPPDGFFHGKERRHLLPSAPVWWR